jgi:hypothetical protein
VQECLVHDSWTDTVQIFVHFEEQTVGEQSQQAVGEFAKASGCAVSAHSGRVIVAPRDLITDA